MLIEQGIHPERVSLPSGEVYENLMDLSSEGIIIYEPTGEIIQANQSFLDLFQYDDNEINSRNIEELNCGLFCRNTRRLTGYKTISQQSNLLVYTCQAEKQCGTPILIEVKLKKVKTPRPLRIALIRKIDEKETDELVELRKTKNDLLEKQQLLAGVIENEYAAVYVKDLEGRYLMVNSILAKRFGKRKEDLVGKTSEVIIEPEMAALSRKMDEQIIATKKPIQRQEDELMINGRRMVIDSIKFPIFGDHGEIKAIAGLAFDITKLKEKENLLKASEERYRNLYHKTPVMMHSLNTAGEIINVNNYWLSIMGYSHEEVMGKKSIDFLTEESRALVVNTTFPKFLEKGEIHDIELQFIKKNGEIIDVILNASMEEGNEGEKVLLATILEITEKKRAERELIEREQYFSSLAEVSPVGIYRTDKQGKCIYVNDNWCKLAGMDLGEATGHGWAKCLHPEDKKRVLEEWHQSIKKKVPFQSEYRFLRPDGSFSWLYGQATMETDYQGKPKGFVGTITDISKLKKIEKQLEQLVAKLEEKNKELVEKKELEKVNKDLSRANKELREFAYMASHDLKAPLRGISNLTDWIQSDCQDSFNEEGRKLLQLLIGRVKYMELLIDDILKYSKLGSENPMPEKVDLNEVLDKCLKMLDLPDHCSIDLEEKLPKITGVRANWLQVFQNLIDNAIKHNDKPQIIIRINAQSDDIYHTISVKDNGPGIEEKHSKRVFKIFQTLENKYTDNRTGIGLSIVKKVVELNQGHIWLESEIGKGTTFHFTIPILD